MEQAKRLKEEMSEEFWDTLRSGITGATKSFSSMEMRFTILTIVPTILEDFKEKDPEFYYVQKAKLREFANQLSEQAKELSKSLDEMEKPKQ